MKKAGLILLLFLISASSLRSQDTSKPPPASTITLGQSVMPLNGPWKFRAGDDLRWADPNYNDSGWQNMDITPKEGSFDPTAGWSGYTPGWTTKGYPDYSGYAWYRIRVQFDARPGEGFALAGPSNVDDSYQVFANGVLLGSFGKFANDGSSPVVYYSQPMMFHLPQARANGPQVLLLAFRVWMEPNTLLKAPDAGGFHDAPLFGQTGAITVNYELARLTLLRTYSFTIITAALFFLLTIMAGSLVLFDDEDPVYKWLALAFFLIALERGSAAIGALTQSLGITSSLLLEDVILGPLILGTWVTVWYIWFRLRRSMSWMPNVIVLFTLLYMFSNAIGEDLFFTVIPHPISVLFHFLSICIRFLFLLPLVMIVMEGVNRQGLEGLLALPAVMLVVAAQFQQELAVLHFRTAWFPFDAQVTLAEVSYITLAAVIFALLLRRLLHSLQHQQELASDVRQAQEIQQILIPEKLPHVAGLAIESEYRPARDVGGDFFQIIPHATDGSVLVIAGDVTGKGLQAGMLGALIVGAARSEAAHGSNPLAILQSLNTQLCERGHACATCLVLHIKEDLNTTLANAGHIPPFLNGKELPMKGALPLGIIPNAEFSTMRFQLEPGDYLMLCSDGVAEAQNEQGRLFGFDRIRQMLMRPITAAELAAAAQTFGQQDDISVLSISCSLVPGKVPIWRTQPIA